MHSATPRRSRDFTFVFVTKRRLLSSLHPVVSRRRLIGPMQSTFGEGAFSRYAEASPFPERKRHRLTEAISDYFSSCQTFDYWHGRQTRLRRRPNPFPVRHITPLQAVQQLDHDMRAVMSTCRAWWWLLPSFTLWHDRRTRPHPQPEIPGAKHICNGYRALQMLLGHSLRSRQRVLQRSAT